jgi:transposase
MLMLPRTVRVYVAVEPVDLRKGFDGLACVVRQVIAEDPLSGQLFVFFNRRADSTKILFWTRNGYTLVHN